LNDLIYLLELHLNDNKITEIKGLENLTNLRNLDLSNNLISELKGFDSLYFLSSLDLENNKITEFKNLEDFNSEMSLYFEGNPIKKEEQDIMYNVHQIVLLSKKKKGTSTEPKEFIAKKDYFGDWYSGPAECEKCGCKDFIPKGKKDIEYEVCERCGWKAKIEWI